jgi:hypothetical protein
VEGAARSIAGAHAAAARGRGSLDGGGSGGGGSGGGALDSGAEPGAPGGRVRVVAAPGSGDDTIAELARDLEGRRLVVTADRELRQRCVAAGASVTGPGWLLGLL